MGGHDIFLALVTVSIITTIVIIGLFLIHLTDTWLWELFTKPIALDQLRDGDYYWLCTRSPSNNLVHCITSDTPYSLVHCIRVNGIRYLEVFPSDYIIRTSIKIDDLLTLLPDATLWRAHLARGLHRV